MGGGSPGARARGRTDAAGESGAGGRNPVRAVGIWPKNQGMSKNGGAFLYIEISPHKFQRFRGAVRTKIAILLF